jgi:hypothetical protein
MKGFTKHMRAALHKWIVVLSAVSLDETHFHEGSKRSNLAAKENVCC